MHAKTWIFLGLLLLAPMAHAAQNSYETNPLNGFFASIGNLVNSVVEPVRNAVMPQPTPKIEAQPKTVTTNTYAVAGSTKTIDSREAELDSLLKTYDNMEILPQYRDEANARFGEVYHLHFNVVDDKTGETIFTGGFLKKGERISTHRHYGDGIPSPNATVTVPYSLVKRYMNVKGSRELPSVFDLMGMTFSGKIRVEPAGEVLRFRDLLEYVNAHGN